MLIPRQSASVLLALLIVYAMAGADARAATILMINNPAEDSATQIGGSTQTEPSSTWCGNTVVTAFADTGSIAQTSGKGLPQSNIGFANSVNAGASFTDRGAASGLTGFATVGPPFVACGSATNVDMAAAGYQFTTKDQVLMFWQSTNSGQSFGTPRVLFSEAPQEQMLFLVETINPANPFDRALTWMTSDESLKACKTGSATIVSAMFTTNGGATWSSPVQVDSKCGSSLSNQQLFAPSPAWLPGNKLGVVYELTNSAQTGFTLEFKTGTAGGFSVSPVSVSPTTFIIGGDFGAFAPSPFSTPSTGLGFLTGNTYEPPEPRLAADNNPASPFFGHLYVVWQAGNQDVPDSFGPGNLYHFNDIYISHSTNGGATWSTPIKVNSNNESTIPSDQFAPNITIDAKGNVTVVWYDRRNDHTNRESDVYSATSTNGA